LPRFSISQQNSVHTPFLFKRSSLTKQQKTLLHKIFRKSLATKTDKHFLPITKTTISKLTIPYKSKQYCSNFTSPSLNIEESTSRRRQTRLSSEEDMTSNKNKHKTYAQITAKDRPLKPDNKLQNEKKKIIPSAQNAIRPSIQDGQTTINLGEIRREISKLYGLIEDAQNRALTCSEICNEIIEQGATVDECAGAIKRLQKMILPYKSITMVDPVERVQQLRITYHFPASKEFSYPGAYIPGWTMKYATGDLTVEELLKKLAPSTDQDVFKTEIINQLNMVIHHFMSGYGPKPGLDPDDLFYYLISVQKGTKYAPYGSLMSLSEAWTAPYLARVVQQENVQTLFVECTVYFCQASETERPAYPSVASYVKTNWGSYSPSLTQYFGQYLGSSVQTPSYFNGSNGDYDKNICDIQKKNKDRNCQARRPDHAPHHFLRCQDESLNNSRLDLGHPLVVDSPWNGKDVSPDSTGNSVPLDLSMHNESDEGIGLQVKSEGEQPNMDTDESAQKSVSPDSHLQGSQQGSSYEETMSNLDTLVEEACQKHGL
jgi:hypothetical protein